MTTTDAPHLPLVGASNDFLERRLRLYMTQDEIATEAGMNRDTVSAIQGGGGSAKKRRDLDEALTRLEEEGRIPPFAPPAPAEVVPAPRPAEPEAAPVDTIRLTFHDVFGVGEIIAEGPSDKPDELVAAVAKLLAETRAKEQ